MSATGSIVVCPCGQPQRWIPRKSEFNVRLPNGGNAGQCTTVTCHTCGQEFDATTGKATPHRVRKNTVPYVNSRLASK